MESSEIREILLNKYCNALQDTNKRQRKIALENINKELSLLDENELVSVFQTIQKYLIRCIHDDSEACREYVVSLITELIKRMPPNDSILGYLFPELRERLGGKDIQEPSEEVRLLIVSLLRAIVAKYDKGLAPYLDDYIDILKKTIVDPYHNVKKESCECAAELGKALPVQFHHQSESLIKPMIQAMGHQHFRIRVAVIKSLGDVILYGNNSSVDAVAGPLAERLFDQNAAVRLAVAKVTGMWLLELRDRYSYFHKIIPLALTSLLDELPGHAEEAWKMWEEAGTQWAKENDTDIKDRLDFLPEEILWYPNGVRRPNLGCRTLVQREMSKYIPGIINELTEWKVDVRVKSAQLLCTTIQHAEQRITQSLAKLLPAMFKAFCDEDLRVVVNVRISAELIGYFVPPEVYCLQILPAMEEITTTGNLGILAAAVAYSPAESIVPELEKIAEILNKDDCCFSTRPREQEQVLNLISSLIKNCGEACSKTEPVKQRLFNVLVSVHGLAKSEDASTQVKDLLLKLENGRDDQGSGEDRSVIRECTPKMLERLQPCMDQWTVHSPQLSIFELLFVDYADGVAASLDIVLSMLKDAVEEAMDAEVVLRILWTVFNSLQDESLIASIEDKDLFFQTVLTDVLVKRLVWQAGRSAEALRTAAAACLDQGLRSMLAQTALTVDRDLLDLFLPHTLSLVEDPAEKTRAFACDALVTLIAGAKSVQTFGTDDANKLLTVVMKRLDDVSDKVRRKCLQVITAVYAEPNPAPCSDNINSALCSTLLVHLDDPKIEFRVLVLDTLKTVGKLNPEGVLNKISLDKFCDKEISKQLYDYLKLESAQSKSVS